VEASTDGRQLVSDPYSPIKGPNPTHSFSRNIPA
jgi:hypothetical protein